MGLNMAKGWPSVGAPRRKIAWFWKLLPPQLVGFQRMRSPGRHTAIGGLSLPRCYHRARSGL